MKHFDELIATFLYTGKFPWAPGTVGSLAGLLLFVAMADKPWGTGIVFFLILIAGVFSSGRVEKALGEKDPKCVVIDEVAGIFIVFFMIPVKIKLLILGFCLYRWLDIVKPFGARHLERLPGGWGIMSDDLLCGIYANLILRILLHFGFFV